MDQCGENRARFCKRPSRARIGRSRVEDVDRHQAGFPRGALFVNGRDLLLDGGIVGRGLEREIGEMAGQPEIACGRENPNTSGGPAEQASRARQQHDHHDDKNHHARAL